jgi:peroxiredoxin
MTGVWKAGALLGCLALLPFACSFARPLPVGSEAPDFTLPLADSGEVTLSRLNKENPVLVIFWATWCPTCREEIPAVNDLYEKKTAQGLKILAVNIEEKRSTVEEFIKKQSIRYPVALDERGVTSEAYGLSGVPVVVFLEKGGKILYYGFKLPEHIDQLLEQRRS